MVFSLFPGNKYAKQLFIGPEGAENNQKNEATEPRAEKEARQRTVPGAVFITM
jgi:hypothetical protein